MNVATISTYEAEQTSWQAPKDAKSPLTRAMMCDVARMVHQAHQDFDPAAIYDGLVRGLSTRVRRVKYAQTNHTKNRDDSG